MTRTKQLEAHVDSLVYDAKTVDVRLHNTFNQFLMLSNSQFIENVSTHFLYKFMLLVEIMHYFEKCQFKAIIYLWQRVYDDDGTDEPPKEEEVKPNQVEDQSEEVLLPKYTQAISLGMVALRISIDSLIYSFFHAFSLFLFLSFWITCVLSFNHLTIYWDIWWKDKK